MERTLGSMALRAQVSHRRYTADTSERPPGRIAQFSSPLPGFRSRRAPHDEKVPAFNNSPRAQRFVRLGLAINANRAPDPEPRHQNDPRAVGLDPKNTAPQPMSLKVSVIEPITA